MTSKRAPGKVVIVSQYYAPDPTTTAIYLTAIADGLKTDREVLVISGTAHSATSETARPRVVEVSTWAPEKNALARRALAMALVSIKMFFATLKHATRNDVVLSVTAPFVLPYTVTLAAKLRGASAILLIHDLYPEALVLAELMQPESFVVKTLRLANRLLFGALDAIITIGRDVEPLLLTYGNVESHKIRLIPNWVLLPIGYREITSDNSFRRGFTDKMVVGLSGNLGFTHSTATVYEAAQLLENEMNIHFLLSGSGAGWKQLTERLARTPLNNVTLVNRVPQSELAEFLSAADVWIIPYRRNVAGVSVPSRIYNLFAVGRPVIVTAEASSEAALMLKEENIGWVVKPEDPPHLAQAIRSAAANPEQTRARGRRAALVAQRYTYDRAIASYRQVISDVVHANR